MIINDANFHAVRTDPLTEKLCGCLPRRSVYGSLPFALPTTRELIPWEEMPDRIADQERNKSSLEHLMAGAGIGLKNQNPLNYCWMFSGALALEIERAAMGLPYRNLSASSIGAPIVQFRNVGYWPEAALKAMVNQGAATTEFVPDTTCDPRDFKPGWRESAAKNKVTMWEDIPPRNAQMLLTMLLQNKPCPVGLDWWAHSVCFVRALDRYPRLDANNYRRYGVKFPNTWGDWWGTKGWGVVEGDSMLPDQVYAVAQATFTE